MANQCLLLALLGATSVHAFWRMECHGQAGLARIDPLVNFGVSAAHVHAIHGSSAFTPTSTNADLLAGSCTSCDVTQDKSVYWHPALYFQDATTNQFEAVDEVGGMLAYYLQNANPGETTVTAFPPGFRMISGTSSRRNYTLGVPDADPEKSIWAALGQTNQADLEQRAVGFNCLNYAGTAEGSLMRHAFPTKQFIDANCPQGIRAEIMFPSCWNGKDIDSPDHKSHVAYADLVMDGGCPSDFPIKLVGLFFETIWDTAAFASRNGRFVFANGDPTGYGYHADFMEGWPAGGDFLKQAVAQCTSLSGRIQDCPMFDIQEDKAVACKLALPDALKGENVKGPFASLPGGVVVSEGPEAAPAPAAGGAAAAPPPVAAPAVSDTPEPPAPEPPAPEPAPADAAPTIPGAVFYGGETSSSAPPAVTAAADPPPPPPPAPETTAPPPPPPPADPNVKYIPVSTEYRTVGESVQEIVWMEAVVYVYDDVVSTTTIIMPPGYRARRDAADEVEAVLEGADPEVKVRAERTVNKVEVLRREMQKRGGESAKEEETVVERREEKREEHRHRHFRRHAHGRHF